MLRMKEKWRSAGASGGVVCRGTLPSWNAFLLFFSCASLETKGNSQTQKPRVLPQRLGHSRQQPWLVSTRARNSIWKDFFLA